MEKIESETKEKVIKYIKYQLIKDVMVLMIPFWMLVKFIFEADWAWKILVADGILFFLYSLPFMIIVAAEENCSIFGIIIGTITFILLFCGMVALFIDMSWAVVLLGAGIVLTILCWIMTPIKIKIK